MSYPTPVRAHVATLLSLAACRTGPSTPEPDGLKPAGDHHAPPLAPEDVDPAELEANRDVIVYEVPELPEASRLRDGQVRNHFR